MALDLGFAISLAPKDAMAYFAQRGLTLKTGMRWQDVWESAHARAFTVAGVMRQDVLGEIHASLAKALAQGKTQVAWEKDLIPKLQAAGYWQPDPKQSSLLADADGVVRGKQLAPWRMDTIFRTNMQSSFMAGRYRQMMEEATDRPFWQYVAVMDHKTRPAHRIMHGRVFPYDDPGWGVLFPPVGFRCRCRVRNLSQADVTERGLAVGSTQGFIKPVRVKVAGQDIVTASFRDKTMERAFVVDPGFNFNPGAEWAKWDRVGARVDAPADPTPATAPQLARIAVGQSTWKDYARPDLRAIAQTARPAAPAILPKAASRAAAIEQVAQALALPPADGLRVVNDVLGHPVALRRDLLAHTVAKELDARERYANFILPTLQTPLEMWLTKYDDGSVRRRYIGVYQGDDNVLVVVRVNRDGSLLWNFMQAEDKRLNGQRAGILVYAK